MHATRPVNGEPLNPPIDYDPGPDVLPVSPIDAAIALTNGGTGHLMEVIDDPRPVGKRTPITHSGQWEPIRELLSHGKSKAQQIPGILDIEDLPEEQGTSAGKLLLSCYETPDETRLRLQTFENSENSHHSSIVSNHWHSQAVTAYDLAVAKPILWSEEGQRFYAYLCEVADWRIKVKDPNDLKLQPNVRDKLITLQATGFYESEDSAYKKIMMDTALYYAKGDLPPQVDQAKGADQLSSYIHYETTGQRVQAAG